MVTRWITAPPGAHIEALSDQPVDLGDPGFGRDVVVATSLTNADLAAHFALQLREAGWTPVGGASEGPLAWTTWRIPGLEGWHATLVVYDQPGVDRHAVALRVEPLNVER
jgi:hypothetical protein